MNSTGSLAPLPPPVYIETDPAVIERELVAEWETLTGKPLYPGQAERLFINNRAYREAILRQQVQQAAEQNLVRFAQEPILDYLGELVDVHRLPAQPARVRMRLSMPAPMARDVLVPAGLVVGSDDGQVEFESDADVLITAGQGSVMVNAVCMKAGIAGNGYGPGRVNVLSGDVPQGLAAVNVDVTMGGAEREDSERFRLRILAAPAGFSVAGPKEAYEFFALGAHQDVCCAVAVSPRPCEVDLYVLTTGGVPTQAVRDLVLAAVNGERRRPLTDRVRVPAIRQVDYAIRAELTLLRGADPELTQAAALEALQKWLRGRELMLGADVVPYQVGAVLKVPGVYEARVPSLPAALVLGEDAWAHCTTASVVVAGVADG